MTKNNKFETILDAYQLAEGAQIRAKKYPEEIFTLAQYQADKRGYMAYPLDNGITFNDFGVLITETELLKDYEIASVEVPDVKLDLQAERKVA
ncbi:hypothetical protein [Mucilaginibacter paludis]|uniref:Uncharacterized protein n=1 Tax=Mucilaginibacter paludis DSM 18603 TaxID=714943 RepID=H1Y1A8_9SPHI|nr:hypothetical protein [Mucilaginibacter paludis]EHQ30242.1 hypothetical protein Mucpa_6185 [Mucilaginibacter paludis DSM 18603]